MKRRTKFLLFSPLVIVTVLLAPIAYDLATTSPLEAAYPIPEITCGCGHREYLMFRGDRGLWWNAGHNTEEEYYYTKPGTVTNSLELFDWEHKHVGRAELNRFSIDIQMNGHPRTRIYRQLDWVRLIREKKQGAKEPYRYTTLEDTSQKIFDFRKRKETEPNNAMEPTPVSVTIPATQEVAPLTSVAHLGR